MTENNIWSKKIRCKTFSTEQKFGRKQFWPTNFQTEKNIGNFFEWVKGAELVELKECDFEKDPVRPELDNEFRTSFGRKIYGVKYMHEIHAVMCFAFTNEIPKTVEELDNLSKDAFLQSALRDQKVGKIAIAYTCLLYTSPSPRDPKTSRMPSSA